MEQSKIETYLMVNADKFKAETLPTIMSKLEAMPEDRFIMLHALELKNPTGILLIAIFLGLERFFLDDIGLGILKILTCGGFGIWYLIDIFTAIDRTKDYNFRKFMSL